MAYVEIRTSLPDHRKAKALSRVLGMRRPWVVGHLVCLWAWALENVPSSGDLAGITDADLEEAAMWPEDRAGTLVPAMVKAGFIDISPRGAKRAIHDWDDYAGRLLRRREEDRERKRSERAQKASTGRPADTPPLSSGHEAKSDGKPPVSSRARGRDRTAPHRTGSSTEPGEVPTARAKRSTRRPAGASVFGIEPGDERHPVATLLAERFRYRDVTEAQWATLAELVDNEYPTGTRRGAVRAIAWQWLAGIMAALPKRGGDPIEAAIAEVNRRKASRAERAAADTAARDQDSAGEPGAIAEQLAGAIGSKTNGHARVTRESAIEQLRSVRGQVPEPAWSQMLERYDVTEQDLDDSETVDFGGAEEPASHA